jgi:hypothetical protein
MLGTSSSYVTFTLKIPSFVYTFISKAIKKHSLLVALLRIDLNPLARSESSFLYHAIRARPDPTTNRAEPPLGARWGATPQSPDVFSFFDRFFDTILNLPPIVW